MAALLKLGAWGAFANAALFLYTLVMFLVVAPALGITENLIDSPEGNIDLTRRFYWTTFAIYATFLLVHPTLLLTARALRDLLMERAAPWVDLAYALGAIGVAFNVFEATGPIAMNKVVADFHASRPEAAVAAEIAVDAVSNGAHLIGYLGVTAMVLTFSIVALVRGGVPRWLAAYGLIPGLLGIATLVALEAVRPLMFLALVVWFASAGVALRRASTSERLAAPGQLAVT